MSSTPIPLRARRAFEISRNADPADQIERVRNAVHATYAGRIWLLGDKPHWLDDEGALKPLPVARFRSLVPAAAVFLDKDGDESDVPKTSRIPRQIVDDVYNHPDFAESIKGIRRCPWVDADGVVHNQAGTSGGWLLHWEGDPADPDDISDTQMSEVLDRLLDFEFVDNSDRIAYLGLLLRAVRPMVGHPCPLTLISATTANSGKSYAAQVLGLILEGVEPQAQTPKTGPELGYSLQAYIRAQMGMTWIDNVATGSKVGDPELHALLTASGDVLSRTVKSSDLAGGDPTRSIWLMTGNLITLDEEQARRSILVRLQRRPAGKPWLTPNLLQWVASNRRLIVCALLRYVVEWHRRGARPPERSLSSFDRWNYLIGGPASELDASARGAWLSEASRPQPPVHVAWAYLFSDVWPRVSGRFPPLASKNVLALVDEHEIAPLQELAGTGTDRSRVTRLSGAMRSVIKRDAEAPLLGIWRLHCKTGRPGYWPSRVEPPDAPGSPGGIPPSDLSNLSNLPNLGSTSKTEVEPGPVGPVQPVGPISGTPPARPQLRALPPLNGTSLNKGSTGSSGYTEVVSKGNMGVQPTNSRLNDLAEVRRASVALPDGDPAEGHLQAIANRGMRVDAALWKARSDAAEAELASTPGQEAADRLRGLRGYGTAIWAQAVSDPEQRVRCGWAYQSAGRMGTEHPNVQGVTKSFGLREAVIAAEGHRLIVADYTGAHMRIAASLSGDQALIAALASGDLYEQAAQIWTPKLRGTIARKATKLGVLATINGAGPQKLQSKLAELGVQISAPEAKARRDRWLEQFPGLGQWLAATAKIRKWQTPLGRTVEIPPEAEGYKSISWHLMAVEADALRLVMRRYTGRIVFLSHDEVVAEEPIETAEAMGNLLRSTMDSALAKVLGRRTLGATTCTVDVRDTWGKSPANTNTESTR